MAITFAFGVPLGHSWTFHKAIERITPKRRSPTLVACARPCKVQRKSCLPPFVYWSSNLVKTAITFAFGVPLGHSWTFHKAIERTTPKRSKSNSNSLREAFQSSTQVMSSSFCLLVEQPREKSRNFRIRCPSGTILDFS